MASTTLPGTLGSFIRSAYVGVHTTGCPIWRLLLDMLRRDHPRRRRSGRADRQAPRLRRRRVAGRAANARTGEGGEPAPLRRAWRRTPIKRATTRNGPGKDTREVEGSHSVRLIAVASMLFLAAACTNEAGSPEPSAGTDAARLSRLGLTTEIPGRVRRVCARASERATVRVICPEVIPDVPLFTPGAGLHGAASFKPTYYMLSFNNGDPPGPARHWIVGGGLASAVGKWVLTDIANATKGDPELVERRDVGSREVSIYRFPLLSGRPKRRALGRICKGR